MIRELREAIDSFQKIDKRLTEMTRKWGEAHGVTEKDHEKAMEEILREGKAPYT